MPRRAVVPALGWTSGEEILLDDGEHAPVAVDQLSHAEIDRDGRDGHRLVFVETLSGHRKVAHLAERVAHCEVDRGLRIDLRLRLCCPSSARSWGKLNPCTTNSSLVSSNGVVHPQLRYEMMSNSRLSLVRIREKAKPRPHTIKKEIIISHIKSYRLNPLP